MSNRTPDDSQNPTVSKMEIVQPRSSVDTSKRFRPSNGTHGDIFMSEWCKNCKNEHDEETEECCDILNHMRMLNIDAPGYPNELVKSDNSNSGGRCTAFVDKHNGEKAYRCAKTKDMFGATSSTQEKQKGDK